MATTKEMHAKRSHFSPNRAKLYRTDGNRLCEIRLSHSRDNALLLIGNIEYRAHSEPADRTWCLIRDDVEVLCAFALRENQPCVVVEQKDQLGQAIARYRIRQAQASLYEVHSYFDVHGDPLQPSPTAVKSTTAWMEQSTNTSECTTTVTSTTQTCTTTTNSPTREPSSSAQIPQFVAHETDDGTNVCPAVHVFASRDFPTPKSMPEPGEPTLCALFDAHHPRKFRVQLCADIGDVPLSFLFFFFMVLRRKYPSTDSKTIGVTLADELL